MADEKPKRIILRRNLTRPRPAHDDPDELSPEWKQGWVEGQPRYHTGGFLEQDEVEAAELRRRALADQIDRARARLADSQREIQRVNVNVRIGMPRSPHWDRAMEEQRALLDHALQARLRAAREAPPEKKPKFNLDDLPWHAIFLIVLCALCAGSLLFGLVNKVLYG